jgi:hypothetical protein
MENRSFISIAARVAATITFWNEEKYEIVLLESSLRP